MKKYFPVTFRNHIDDSYTKCHFIGVNFKNWSALFNFLCCTFEYCTFEESRYMSFLGCIFRNCTFENTFNAHVKDCVFLGNKPYIPYVCPAKGAFIGWKVSRNGQLIKLLIPADAKRVSPYGERQCRCDKAIVLDIQNIDGTPVKEAVVSSWWDADFHYKVNERIYPDHFDDDRNELCTYGIHFFMERREAINYYKKRSQKL